MDCTLIKGACGHLLWSSEYLIVKKTDYSLVA